MFLTRVLPLKGFVLSRLAERANAGDAYAQHQLLWQLFRNRSDREFLFRFEQGRNGPCYYVLAPHEPSSPLEGVQVLSKPFSPKLRSGDRLAYTLRANPTRMLKADNLGQRGQRVDVLMHAKVQARQMAGSNVAELQEKAAQDWILDRDRQVRLGVEFTALPEITEHQQHQVYQSRNKASRSQPIQFTSVNYQGVLTVKEPEQFLEALKRGVGRAKAMGCGLMMIRRCH